MKDNIKIINSNNKNGQFKCPNCGASNLHYDINKERLICEYCNEEFDKNIIEDKKNPQSLDNEVRGNATKDIDNNSSDLVTIKCDGCCAEVVVNTRENLNVRCHWCGSDLSVNKQVDNGIIPDEILPFKITKEKALENINKYAYSKLSFTTSDFRNGLNLENIRGVYFPYLIFDTNAHGNFKGVGEHNIRTYSIDDETYYDVDVYNVEREFDLYIDDLTIESNFERLNKYNLMQKNNVINAIMPFDTENCVKFNANYLKDFTSEKRDVDIKNVENRIDVEVKDIARIRLNNSLGNYDRGVSWESENIEYNGKQWISAYLPVWLYSYQDKKKVIHYVAVNGRTGETVGSIPLDNAKLWLVISIIFFSFVVLGIISAFFFIPLLFLFVGVGFLVAISLFIVEDYKYSNSVWIRHNYEYETKNNLKYTNSVDEKIETKKKVRFQFINNRNNNKINGEYIPINRNTK